MLGALLLAALWTDPADAADLAWGSYLGGSGDDEAIHSDLIFAESQVFGISRRGIIPRLHSAKFMLPCIVSTCKNPRYYLVQFSPKGEQRE